MERRSSNTQGVRKTIGKESATADIGGSRHVERGQERLRLVNEAQPRPGIPRTAHETTKPGQDITAGSVRHRRRRRRVTARFFRIVASAFIVFLLLSYGIAFWRIAQVERKIRSVHNQIVAAEKRNNQMQDELKKSASEAYVEEAAREDLGLVKPGETAWVVVTPEDPNSPFRVEKRGTPGVAPGMEGW